MANDGFVVLVFGVMRRTGVGYAKISLILGLFTYVSFVAVLCVLLRILFCVWCESTFFIVDCMFRWKYGRNSGLDNYPRLGYTFDSIVF